MVLIANERKVMSKGHDKVLDILHYLLFDDTLIYINSVTLANLFNIDKVKQIFILKHLHSAPSFCWVINGMDEIIRNVALMSMSVLFYQLLHFSYG